MLRLKSNGEAATGLTITDFDLQYTREGEAPSIKVDATALSAADDPHADNKIFEVDSTSSPGLYRVDWPDAAFADGVEVVFLSVTHAGGTIFAETQKINIDPPVDVVKIGGVDVDSPDQTSVISTIPTADQLVTIVEAQAYLDGYLNTLAWDEATSTRRNKALQEATSRMNRLNYKEGYPDTSDDFKEACSLIANRLLDGMDMEQEADSLTLKSMGISSARLTREGQPPHFIAGIPSQMAWYLLLPYLEGLTTVELQRIS
jgi:hypothetical protein